MEYGDGDGDGDLRERELRARILILVRALQQRLRLMRDGQGWQRYLCYAATECVLYEVDCNEEGKRWLHAIIPSDKCK